MMASKGICGLPRARANDQHPCTANFCSALPNLEAIVKKQICIPVGWWVTPEQPRYIVESIKGGW